MYQCKDFYISGYYRPRFVDSPNWLHIPVDRMVDFQWNQAHKYIQIARYYFDIDYWVHRVKDYMVIQLENLLKMINLGSSD